MASEEPIDKEWLARIINKRCNGAGILLDTESRRIGETTGFMSHIHKVRLFWEDSSGNASCLPSSVITKKPSISGLRNFGDFAFKEDLEGDTVFRLHNRECGTYSYLDASSGVPPIPIPKCYYARQSSDNDPGLLVVGDVSEGTSLIGFGNVANEEQVEQVAEHLANLHAYNYHNREYRQVIAEEFFPFEKSLDTVISHNAPYLRQNHPDIFKYSDDEIKAFVESIKEPSGIRIFQDPSRCGHIPVLCLGDVQPNNILWKNSYDRSTPDAVTSSEVGAFIDFQASHIGNCMSDLAYFMMLSVSSKERPAMEHRAIQHYREVLETKPGVEELLHKLTTSELTKLYRISLFQFCVTFLPLAEAFIKHLDGNKISKASAIGYLDRMVDGIEQYRQEAI